jgi:hypothetical protein
MGDVWPFELRRVNHGALRVPRQGQGVEFYRDDPDGIHLELAAWTRTLGPKNVRPAPVRATTAPD